MIFLGGGGVRWCGIVGYTSFSKSNDLMMDAQDRVFRVEPKAESEVGS